VFSDGYAVQPRRFWQAADQVRILHRLPGRSLAEIVDHAHRDHQVAVWIGCVTDEREIRAGSPFGLRRLVGHADECPPGVRNSYDASRGYRELGE
jgi:hypothetical protein